LDSIFSVLMLRLARQFQLRKQKAYSATKEAYERPVERFTPARNAEIRMASKP